MTLILDIWFTGSTTTNFGTLGTNNTGRKLYSLIGGCCDRNRDLLHMAGTSASM
jgi:hypothetical protein